MMRTLTLLAGLSLIATLAMADVKKDGDTSPVRVGAEVIAGASKAIVIPASGEAPSVGARAKSK